MVHIQSQDSGYVTGLIVKFIASWSKNCIRVNE